MRQHAINLLPASILARSEAVMRTSRFAAAAVVALAVSLMLALHSLVVLIRAQEELFATSLHAERVYAMEAKALELKAALEKIHAAIAVHDRIAIPINISAVMATVINELPATVTLDQFDIDAGARATARAPRAKGPPNKDELPPRVLTCEVSGFASNDQQIAELVGRLSRIAPFREVAMDFSRTRTVNGRAAREFRLSFKIDLDLPYEVAYRTHDLERQGAALSTQQSDGESPGAADVPH